MLLPHHWTHKLHEVVFEADTPAGRTFDLFLLMAIVLSVSAVALESVPSIASTWGTHLRVAEWVFTAIFTVEYILRLLCLHNPWRYARSFYGLVDLASTLPTWIGLFLPGAQAFLVIRILRLLRVFRVLKLGRWLGEALVLGAALRGSARKIGIFLGFLLTVILIAGTVMYLVEGPEHGFTDIPTSMYWAVVTLTTVGYGDIYPATPLGKFIASALMISGYGVLAVPTGIVSVELAQAMREVDNRACQGCGADGHNPQARFCRTCGHPLD
jgi:voltage-gated potassium channel